MTADEDTGAFVLRRLAECLEFEASDGCRLREWLHPMRGAPGHLPFSVASAWLEVGQRTVAHALRQVEVYLFLRGAGQMQVESERRAVTAGDAVVVPPGALQWVENTGAQVLEFLVIVCPPWRAEEDWRLS